MKNNYRGRSFSRPHSNGGNYSQRARSNSYGRRTNAPRRFGAKIDPRMYILPATEHKTESVYVDSKLYKDFDLNHQIQINLVQLNYTHPTHIQDLAIPPALSGRDVLAQASTGTGKTAAFLLPMLNKLLLDQKQKCLIILPTRELALQTYTELGKFANGTFVRAAVIMGGASMYSQKRRLMGNPHFVIATPGRLKDLWQQKAVRLEDFNNIVLDEVDRMLDMGFVHDIRQIISKLNSSRQSIFVSATMDKRSEQIATELLRDPVCVRAAKQSPQANVDQNAIHIQKGADKTQVLHDLLITEESKKVLIFSRTKHGAEKLSKQLSQLGHRVDTIHGDKPQSKRSRVIEMYRRNEINILVATDVVARGLDVVDITHVINYDEPNNYEDYIHRIGRTGRIGKIGKAITFVE